MSDIHLWVCEHDEELGDVARRLGLEPATVHLVAVLVLGGLSDEEVLHQLRHLVDDGVPVRAPAWATELVAVVRSMGDRSAPYAAGPAQRTPGTS